ncbi:GNAT family N-acetyltransferase [Candidatus Thorarchaeota archaeon]|nr:MAG: GNAT family N-acetyltransferase [Candidatus Thorarchaeota archaeon]
MLVRQYEKGDEEKIAEIYNRAFQKQISSLPKIYQYRKVIPENVVHWRDGGANTFWIMEDDGRPIGYAQVRIEVEIGKQEIPILQFMPARSWDLNESNFAVHPDYQRRGIASDLIREIIKRYQSEVMFATALTFSDNTPAEALLSSLDFKVHDFFYYEPFSEKYPLENSSIYGSFELKGLPSVKVPIAEISFRRAEQKDAELILTLHEHNVFWCRECLTLEWNRNFIDGKYGHTVFVAEHEGRVIGAIDYYEDGRIGITGVLPEYRGKGFGSAMFYEVLKEMKRVGYESVFVDSGLTQTDAIEMYERFGFTIERRQNCWIKILR